jgi:hypothetical protein
MSGGRFDVSSLRRGTHAYAHVTVHFSICALTLPLPEFSQETGKKLRSSRPIEKEFLQASQRHTSVALEVSVLQLLA